MISRRSLCLTALGAATLLAGCDKLGFSSASKPSFQGVDLTGAAYARGFSLPDQYGRTRSLDDFKGKVVVVFFGFTQCPDVCPTTLAELAQVKKALGPDGDKVQGVFITVDPERDKPELLKAYLESFDPGFVALRGSPEQLKEVAKEFKVYYAKVPGKTPDSYTMDHTAASFLFDPQGRVRVFSRYGAGTQALMGDIKALLAGQ
ncbi:SCO family protein [Roseateles aquatilis]|uniref:SCO family protein n=1 Tax=Roseateles aquatilis TaxID=431061 RepID=A0A246J545_9BURK|nr:SCO family protein [Roseateles aquatilis]OWQ87750.1 SCO family protein [Roseateles aquatilis]